MKDNFYLLGILLLLFCNACDEQNIEEFDNQIAFVQFFDDATKDTTFVTFKSYPDGNAEIPIIIKRFGRWDDEILKYRIGIDTNLSTLPLDMCDLPEDCLFDKYQEFDTLLVNLSYFDLLKDSVFQLVLRVEEDDIVKEGVLPYRRSIIRVTDKLLKPKWWTVLNGGYAGHYTFNVAEVYYLGKYSEKKYLMFIEELNKDGAVFDGTNLSVLRIYSLRLKYRIEEYNRLHPNDMMYDEENNEYMTIPVAG